MRLFLRLPAVFLTTILISATALAATFTVTKTADTNDGTCDADCSLREAVAAAGAAAGDDVIEFSSLFSTVQTITLGGTDIIITSNGALLINGPGAALLTVSGNSQSRVFTNNTGSVATIRGIRVTGGTGASTVSTGRGGGVYNSGGTLTLENMLITGNTAANGGGVNNAGTATLNVVDTEIFSNTVTGAGGGMQNFSGNTTNIVRSSIYNNTCNTTSTGGGGIQANGTVNIVNSTFSGNTATGGSGGAIFFNGTLMNITNSTFSQNASTNNGAIHRTTTNLLNIRNSIVAGNNGTAASPDYTGAAVSLGNNIIGNVGTSTGWIASDLQNTNPLLGPLADNGGPTRTYLPQPGSPAINGGQNCVVDLSCPTDNPNAALTTDQRGLARLNGANVDIGSVEVAAAAFSIRGRVLDSGGTPIRSATITISSANTFGIPSLATIRTSGMGYFRIADLAAGTYSVTASAKGHTFTPVQVPLNADVTDLIITAGSSDLTDR